MPERTLKIGIVVDADGAIQKMKEFDGATQKVTTDLETTGRALKTFETATKTSTDEVVKGEKANNSLVTTLKGYASGYVIGQAIRSTIDYGDEIKTMSERAQIGVREIQRLSYAANQNGTDIGATTSAIGILSDRIAGGDASAVRALQALGLNFQAVRAQDPYNMFLSVSNAIKNIRDESSQLNIAKDLLGPGGMSQLPLMKADLEALGDEAERFGLIMDKSAVEGASKFDAAWKAAAMGVKAAIADMLSFGPNTQNSLGIGGDLSAVGADLDWLLGRASASADLPKGSRYTAQLKASASANGAVSMSPEDASKLMDQQFGNVRTQMLKAEEEIANARQKFQDEWKAFDEVGSQIVTLAALKTNELVSTYSAGLKAQTAELQAGVARIDTIIAQATQRIDVMTNQVVQADSLSSQLDALDADRLTKLKAIDNEFNQQVANIRAIDPTINDATAYNLAGGDRYEQARGLVESEYGTSRNKLAIDSANAREAARQKASASTSAAGGAFSPYGGGGGGGMLFNLPMWTNPWAGVPLGITPGMPGFGAFAKGGVVDRPTFALLGEGGEREWVIPESKMGGGGVTVVINAQGAVFEDERALDRLADKMQRRIAERYSHSVRLPGRG